MAWSCYAAAVVLVLGGPWLLAHAYSSPPDYQEAFSNWFTQSAIALVAAAPLVRAAKTSSISSGFQISLVAGLILVPPALLLAYDHFLRIDPTEPAPEDPKKAARYYRLRCNARDSNSGACAELGYLHETGQGVEPDMEKALQLYRKGCEGWSDWACYQLGSAYEHGRGVAPSPEQSRTFYEKSCGIYGPSCGALGDMFRDGVGVAKDARMAAELYLRACDHGEPSGCTNLGALYEGGDGIERDWPRAVSQFERACYHGRGRSGQVEGCYNLGVMYLWGRGVEKNAEKARELFQKACDSDFQPGCDALQ